MPRLDRPVTANGAPPKPSDSRSAPGVDLEQSSSGPSQPLVQQLAAHWEHCDRDGRDAFERLVPPLSARSSVRRADLSISTCKSALGAATAMMPDVMVGLTPSEQNAPQSTVQCSQFESLTAASVGIPIEPLEALAGGAVIGSLRAALTTPNKKCQVHQSHAQALPIARPPECACSGGPGRHRPHKQTALASRTPLEELEEWRRYACPQALPHLDQRCDRVYTKFFDIVYRVSISCISIQTQNYFNTRNFLPY